MVMAFISTSRDQIEAPRSPFINCELSPHPTQGGEQMGERNAALLLWNFISQYRLEPIASTGARYFHLGKSAHILQRHVIHYIAAFFADKAEIIGAAERPLLNNAAIICWQRVIVIGQGILLVQFFFRN